MSRQKAGARMGDPYATIGFALKQAQQALRTRLDSGLREIGLTTPQYAVLAFLEVEAGASNAALARRAAMEPGKALAQRIDLYQAEFAACEQCVEYFALVEAAHLDRRFDGAPSTAYLVRAALAHDLPDTAIEFGREAPV